jgi:hypothetical protein
MREQMIAPARAIVHATAVYAGAASTGGVGGGRTDAHDQFHRYAELTSQSCPVPQMG